ncbi:hypothetical protein [Magnetococcus sp. PR-3]|uniref:hypothetical protein n=1 Tax=Magnetococcus sp. PR-3 TaxID=3120355 RepID=UPI002FCE4B17
MAKDMKIKLHSEEIYFRKKEAEYIEELKKKALKDADKKYRKEHKQHCYRCGTQSLVEAHKGKATVFLCVNEGCGAIHMERAALKAIVKDAKAKHSAIKSFIKRFT